MVDNSIIAKVTLSIVGIVILLSVFASLVPITQSAGDDLGDENQCTRTGCFFNATSNATTSDCTTQAGNSITCATSTGIPLSTLFAGGGVLFLIVMAGLFLLVLKGQLPKA